MQVSNSDPAIANAAIQMQIDTAVATRAHQVHKQQGEAAVQLVEAAAEITAQLASGHIDVTL